MRMRKLHLFCATYGAQHDLVNLNLEISVSTRAHAKLTNIPYQDTLYCTTQKK